MSSRIEKRLYSTLVAPYMEDPRLAITFAFSPSSSVAARVAIRKPGKDPLEPMATVSPFSSPASWK